MQHRKRKPFEQRPGIVTGSWDISKRAVLNDAFCAYDRYKKQKEGICVCAEWPDLSYSGSRSE